jgi:hypothetical protein
MESNVSASDVEVARILPHGFWLVIDSREVFLLFEDFPWFMDAPVRALLKVERPQPQHLRWPDLDVDLTIDSITRPWRYPLMATGGRALQPVGDPQVHGLDDKEALRREIQRIQERFNSRPVLDHRTPDEIIGYDENGLPS